MRAFLFNHKMSYILRSVQFLFLVSSFLIPFVSPTQHFCHPDQRDALLEFKAEFRIQKPSWVYNGFVYLNVSSYPKTKSWVNNSDCCFWDGITCDAKSGEVVGIDLSASCLHGRLESNISLFRLRQLRDLNLAYNNFTTSPIPAEFDKLKGLERLNLSESSFSGQVPTKLLELTKLVSLDLSSSYSLFMYSLSVDESFLRLLAQNLRNLEHLDMSSINISSKIPHEFSNMWSLKSLRFEDCNLFGEFPSSVFLIPNLQSIELDYNGNLRGNLPTFRENNSMQILSLSETSFSGPIPESISNLKHLTSLILSSPSFSGRIPSSLGNLSSLSYLHLSVNNFIGEIPSSLGNLSSLSYLDLSFNNFTGEIPSSLGNLSSLSYLDLSFNKFIGEIPSSLGNLSSLSYLDLFLNNFIGEIPSSLGNLSSLSYLDLSSNNFIGEIPSSIGNLKQLVNFEVEDNKFSGNFPSGLLNLTQLRVITLCSNHFSGFLPPNISQFSNLELFRICYNSFMGVIPSYLFKIPSLVSIYMDRNQFSDLVGIENIFLLPDLQDLNLGNNKFIMASPVDLNVFSPLKKLKRLYLSGIPLSTTNITYDSDFRSHLEYLDLSGCNITELPEFIRRQRNLYYLNLSNNKIKGQLPDWLWRLPELRSFYLSNNSFSGFKGSLKALPESKIDSLDLSSNTFQGPLFIPSMSINYFFGSKNNFTGEIPRLICELTSLAILDLSNNNFHGSIPRCLENQMSSLLDLNLRNNILSGSLPDIFKKAKELMSLDVSHNQLEGKLPASLTGCSVLEILNVGSNRINDMFPFQLNSLQNLQVLVIRSNKFHGMLYQPNGVWFGFPQLKIIDVSHNNFHGVLPSNYFLNWTAISLKTDNTTELNYLDSNGSYYTSLVLTNKGVSMEMERILKIYTAIDFSGNQLHGKIPNSVGLLKQLHILNLSSNAFTGHIPSSLENLTNLESLDLSQNKISGEIPPELGALSSLEWINVSHNQLVGSIPQGTQFQRQNCSSYEGNPGIDSHSLKDICGDNHVPTSPQPEMLESKEEEEEKLFSWVAASLGLVLGVLFGLGIGYKVASDNHDWFMKTLGRSKHHGRR